MSRLLYTLVLWLLLPWVFMHLLWRGRRQPEYLRHWRERFGIYRTKPPAPIIWLHAVSVGETRAAQPLVSAIKQAYPGHRILLTHMTPTGRETSQTLFGDDVERIYLPYDYPSAVARFLDHFQPRIGLIIETELWPNLIAACKARGVPLALVNARMSEKSARRYARFPQLTLGALRSLTAIAAQSDADATRLRKLGAPHVDVFGNIKFDITPPPEQLDLARIFRQRLGDRPVFLTASTREGEEALLLEVWKKVVTKEAAPPLLVIVPRHPQRFDAVAQLVEAQGLCLQRRSDNAVVAAGTQVWLGDSMGEMFGYYAAADVAFIGGSLLDNGSQNPIEPCAVGTPVLIGTSTYNFALVSKDALACGAARQVVGAAAIVAAATSLLASPLERQQMREAGMAFAARQRGATARTMELLTRVTS
jgi:3-deoxy-D-manno-octulosonic-acid transferase